MRDPKTSAELNFWLSMTFLVIISGLIFCLYQFIIGEIQILSELLAIVFL